VATVVGTTPAGGSGVMVDLEQAAMRFGHQWAVRDVTLRVPAGSIVGLFGPSGCGKTTTIRLMIGILNPTAGEIRVFGVAPRRFQRWHRQAIGYMPQHFVLYPNLSVEENLNFVASLYGLFWLTRGRRLRDVLDRVDLWDHRHKLVRDVSGGMQRRLALACTMVHSPELIVLDEPTAGIDPILRARFWKWFRDLAEREGRTLFVTSQYVAEAENCDVAAVMKDGELIDLAPPLELRRRAMGGDPVDVVAREGPEAVVAALSRHARIDPSAAAGPDHAVVLNAPPRIVYDQHGGPPRVRVLVRDAGPAIPDLADLLARQQVDVESISEYRPPFDDIFAELIRRRPARVTGDG